MNWLPNRLMPSIDRAMPFDYDELPAHIAFDHRADDDDWQARVDPDRITAALPRLPRYLRSYEDYCWPFHKPDSEELPSGPWSPWRPPRQPTPKRPRRMSAEFIAGVEAPSMADEMVALHIRSTLMPLWKSNGATAPAIRSFLLSMLPMKLALEWFPEQMQYPFPPVDTPININPQIVQQILALASQSAKE